MTHGLSTGYFAWNVMSWLLIFLFTAAVFSLFIYLGLRSRGGRLVHIPSSSVRGTSAPGDFEKATCRFRDEYIQPWASLPQSQTLLLVAILLLLLVALFSGAESPMP